MKKNKKIKLATLFSWIWAIEQAFKRLNIEHDIVFACDNWNIEIDIDYDNELENIKKLNNPKEKNEYVRNIYKTKTSKTNFVEISYLENYKIEKNDFFYDVKLLDWTDFENKIDFLVWGSPCQSFSVIWNKWWFDDTRWTLFHEFARIVKETNPKVFIYENVYWMLKHDNWKTWETVKNVFDELWYNYKFNVLDSRDYWIPQWRRRIFVVWFKDKEHAENFNFPNPIKLEIKMQDLLLDNVKEWNITSKNWKLFIDNTQWWDKIDEKYFLSEKLVNYVMSPGTWKFIHKPKIDLEIARALLSTMWNTHRASVNNYITTEWRIRALHPRETHRLMWFPDDYKIVVSKAQAYKQSWNSIVVDVLVHLLKEILKVI